LSLTLCVNPLEKKREGIEVSSTFGARGNRALKVRDKNDGPFLTYPGYRGEKGEKEGV